MKHLTISWRSGIRRKRWGRARNCVSTIACNWGAQPPIRPSGAEVVATRLGIGGMPGKKQTVLARKFVLDFQGGRLAQLPKDATVEAVVIASRGEIREVAARPILESKLWRCHFDLVASGSEPVDLRCYLRDANGALSETWLYQWSPLP